MKRFVSVRIPRCCIALFDVSNITNYPILYIYNDNAACVDYRILQYIFYTPEYLYWFLNISIGHCLLKGK